MSASSGSTVEDQFFLRIAIKNRLLTAEQAAAIVSSLAPGQNVEDLVLERQLLDRAAVDGIRTAMAASQVMRLDALYAELLLERGLAPQHLIDSAFKEQRRQKYRVRIGNLLLQKRLISAESHREVISEVIRRLQSLGQDAYSSASRRAPRGTEARGGGAPPPPPPLPSASSASSAPAAPTSRRLPPPPPLPTPSGRHKPAEEGGPLGLDSGGDLGDPLEPPGQASAEDAHDPFGTSSVEHTALGSSGGVSAESGESEAHMPHGLLSASDGEQSPFASRRLLGPGETGDLGETGDSGASGPVRIPLNDTHAAIPAFRQDHSSALFEPAARRLLREEAVDDLTRSAIRIDLEGEGYDIQADAELLRSDLRDSVDRMADGEDSFVLDRGDLTDEGFEPEAYLKRRQTRGKLLVAAGILGALGVLGILGSATAQVLENRGRLSAARSMIQDSAEAESPGAQQELLREAERELNLIGRTGVSKADKEALAEAIKWGLLRTEVELTLEAQKPQEALALLQQDPDSVPLSKRGAFDELVARCKRERHLGQGRQAVKNQDWALAVGAFREAIKLGDPGGVANLDLARVQSTLREQRDAAREKLRGSLSRQDEGHYKGLQRLLTQLFEEPPDTSLDLEGLRYKQRRAATVAQARGRLTRIEQLEKVRRDLHELLRREDDPELQALVKKVEGQLRVRQLELQGRRAEQRGDLKEAIAAYREASKGAPPGVQRQFQNAITRCEGRAATQAKREKAVSERARAVKFLREGRPEQAEVVLKDLAAVDPRSKLLYEFAQRVRGCCYVPAGEFILGRDDRAAEEGPRHTATLQAFYISQTEVTNLDYATFLDSRAPETRKSWTPRHWTQPRRRPDGRIEGKTFPSGIRKHPVIHVDWNQAQAYARWRGGRLPSEEEWEKAARGTDGRTYPWGENSRSRVQVQVGSRGGRTPTAPVGALADDKSPYGVYDMAGNVHEWTRSEFVPYPGAPRSTPSRPGQKVLRGGAWRWPLADARTTRRQAAKPEHKNDQIGFRFVIEIPQDLNELR